MKMHPPEEKSETTIDTSSPIVQPFVHAFANIGAIMGRDLGVVALRAIENMKGNTGAVCLWMKEHCPKPIFDKLEPAMQEKLFAVMMIPVGVEFPGFLFPDVEVRAAVVTAVDGSKLIAFIHQ